MPSISPAWIPLWIITTGFPSARAAAGVNAPSFDTTTATISRPSPDRPNPITFTHPGMAFSTRRTNSTVSS